MSDGLRLDVRYVDGEPSEIEFFHNTFGLMRFQVEDGVASLDPKWDRLSDRDLKEGFDRWHTTGDVLREVQRLPFVETVAAPEHRPLAEVEGGEEA